MKLSKFLVLLIFSSFLVVSAVSCDDDDGGSSNNNNNTNAVCGNGIIEGNEVCDGTNFGTETCETKGFTGGDLACSSDCLSLDTSNCEGTCTDVCTNGTLVCNGDTLRSCTRNTETGCTEWTDTDCTANNQICAVVNETAQCADGCTDVCTSGNTQCNGNIVQTCETQTNGCTDWSDTTDCANSTQVCVVDSGTAQCADDCTDVCTEGEIQCAGNVVQTCETQTNGCTDWSDTTDCSSNGEVCSTDDGTPQCIAVTQGSCDDPIVITLPYTIDGTDFTADYTSNESFDGTDCTSGHGVEAVFAVDLVQDATLVIEETGTMDSVIRVLDTCDATNAQCLVSVDYGENHVEFVAPATGTYYVVVEVWYSSPSSKGYDIAMFTLDATETSCDDGIDNDGNGATDCEEYQCSGIGTCPSESVCDDDSDDDGDNLIDCDDPDCFGVGSCTTETNCGDGFDNDNDGDIDCADSDCSTVFECIEKKGIYEQFTTSHPNDLNGVRIVYTPDGSGDYTYNVTFNAAYFVTPGSTGDTTFLNADSDTYHANLPFIFNFYGTDYNELWMTSNGVIVFDATPSSSLNYESTSVFFAHPTLAIMWDDLDKINSGDILYSDSGNDGTRNYWAFTYVSKEYGSTNELHAQVVLFDDGEIRVDYIVNEISDAIVGISSPGALGSVDPVNFNKFPTPSSVIFTEIMYDPAAVNDTVGEYVELFNTSDSTVSLAGCELTDSEDTIIIGDVSIPPLSYTIFIKDTDSANNGGISGGYSLAPIAFGNGGDDITLSCPTGTIDTVTFDDNASAGHSLQLDIYHYDAVANDDMANWCQTEVTTYGDGDYGTPFANNNVCGGTTIFSENFETDPSTSSTISYVGDWEWGSPSLVGPSSCPEGSSCFGTVMDGNYSNSTGYDSNYLQIGPIDLTAYNTTNTIELAFYMWLYTENNWDFARVEVSTDAGTTFTVATDVTPSYNHTDEWMGEVATSWTPASVSLSSYAGNTIYIRFSFDADGLVNEPGFYVDDLKIIAR